MRYFLDTEFIEDGVTIDLISIGIACEDGRELYMVSSEFDASKADEWIKTHVLNHIGSQQRRHSRKEIANAIWAFTLEPMVRYREPEKRRLKKPEFWAYYAAYDWIALCQLYGPMNSIPAHLPHYCRDLKQLADDMGNPELPRQEGTNHVAIDDARWNRVAFDFLQEKRQCSLAATVAA